MDKIIGLKGKGSENISLPGASVQPILEAAKEANMDVEGEGVVFIVGGGNGLKDEIPEKTFCITQTLKSLAEADKDKICFVSI